MGSNRPGSYGRVSRVASLFAILWAASCAGRAPRLVPPAAEVVAVDGFGSASIVGTEASVKGKFGFVFRKEGLGRVEAVDPIGRTAFVIIFREGRAWFILPGRKVYAEDSAGAMMERFLGVALEPWEAVQLLSGTWGKGGTRVTLRQNDDVVFADDVWSFIDDDRGRIVEGIHDKFSFKVKSFFPGDAVPREIELRSFVGTSGRVKVLKLAFNPAPRDEAFNTAFLGRFAAKSWDELLELIGR
jgi:hypothetical protein